MLAGKVCGAIMVRIFANSPLGSKHRLMANSEEGNLALGWCAEETVFCDIGNHNLSREDRATDAVASANATRDCRHPGAASDGPARYGISTQHWADHCQVSRCIASPHRGCDWKRSTHVCSHPTSYHWWGRVNARSPSQRVPLYSLLHASLL